MKQVNTRGISPQMEVGLTGFGIDIQFIGFRFILHTMMLKVDIELSLNFMMTLL